MLAERRTFWINSQATSDVAIQWPGGVTAFTAVASAWNAATLTLNLLAPDGQTKVAVGASTTVTANAFVTPVYLPAGRYTADVTGGSPTALYMALDLVPF